MIARTLAMACLVSACNFRGRGVDDLAVVDGAEPDAGACSAIIDDNFDNTDLATAGALSRGDGFVAVANNAGNGTAHEIADGLEIRTSNDGPPVAPTHGAVSNTSFAFDPAGMTVRLEVLGADTPKWNGIALALQSNQTGLDGIGGSLVLRVRGQGTNASQVDMGNQATYDPPLGLQPYDEGELANGFIVTWHLDATSWSYVAEGLRATGENVTDSGGYAGGKTPGDLLDPTVHLGIHIQGNPDDIAARVLHVRRVTLRDSTCP